MEFKIILCFLFLVSLYSNRALAEGFDLEETQVITATPSLILESLLSRDVRCARVPISGLSRLKLGSYSSARIITLTPSDEIREKLHKKIQICSHRNSSLALCKCESRDWGNIQNGSWSSIVSPYEDRYIDVKFDNNLSGSVNVSITLEFQKWRVLCLIIGVVLLFMAPTISRSVQFYYSSSMAIGICLVVIVLLFQGMKLFPLGRKNLLYSSICGVLVGAGTFLLSRLSDFVTSMLVNFGIGEEMHISVLLLLGVLIALAGAGFGYWIVRKFVIAEDGSVHVDVAWFVKWALRVIAVTFISLSTYDLPLAMSLLACLMGLRYSLVSLARRIRRKSDGTHSSSKSRLLRQSSLRANSSNKRAEFLQRKSIAAKDSRGSLWRSPTKGSVSPYGRSTTNESSRDFYSTYHKTPKRKRYSKEEWKKFTDESTRQAVAELASSPEFTDWIVEHADRIRIDSDNSISSDESEDSVLDSYTDEYATQTSSSSGRSRGFFSLW